MYAMKIIYHFILYCLLLLPVIATAQARQAVSLNGPWTFAIDPVKVGEADQWYAAGFASEGFDKVIVPHSFSVDPRYFFYTGTAWYFKKFTAPAVQPGKRVFLRFDAVFYKASVWLNGQLIGNHEGGYTPFEWDVTDQLAAHNTLALQVDNSWDTTTIPGARTPDTAFRPNATQMYAWINYGGITRPVQLITRPAVFVQNLKVVADPDLKKGTAHIQVTAFLRNQSAAAGSSSVTVNIYKEGKKQTIRFAPVTAAVLPGQGQRVWLQGTLPATEVQLWGLDDPQLYEVEVIAGSDTLRRSFGIRKVEVQGTKIVLNGSPVHLGGCNRPLDYPGYGSLDPDTIMIRDLELIKNGGMEFSRISHYPVSEALLNWADAHGLLLIAEAGNWQMTDRQMASSLIRSKYEAQATEMIERDWNHPCIVAYSLGNEFQSQTPEGKAWVKDMGAFVRQLDSSRLITFASYNVWRDYVKKPEDEASQYVDFISANIYGNHLKCLQHIHEIYPDKPVFISEFGMRITETKKEPDVIAYFQKALEAFRQCDYLAGASVWTFNDYMSRYPGSDANGYRAWGLVTPQRTLRSVYTAWQEEFSPAVLSLVKRGNSQATFRITARNDFPSYTLRHYQLRCEGKDIAVKTLQPGEATEVAVPLSAAADQKINVALIKPGGFPILQKIY